MHPRPVTVTVNASTKASVTLPLLHFTFSSLCRAEDFPHLFRMVSSSLNTVTVAQKDALFLFWSCARCCVSIVLHTYSLHCSTGRGGSTGSTGRLPDWQSKRGLSLFSPAITLHNRDDKTTVPVCKSIKDEPMLDIGLDASSLSV